MSARAPLPSELSRAEERELERLVAKLEAEEESSPCRTDAALAGARRDEQAELDAPTAKRRARAELRRVHAIELARLLREAAALRAASERLGPLVPRLAGEVLGRGELRRRAAHELRHGPRTAGLADAHRALRDCLADPPELWPRSLELARAAHALDDRDASRLAIAHALLAQGESRWAVRWLAGVARGGVAPERRWRALHGLELAYEQLGARRRALAAGAALAADGESSAPALAGHLAVCLLAAEDACARKSARSITARLAHAPGRELEVLAALPWIRARALRFHGLAESPLGRGPARSIARGTLAELVALSLAPEWPAEAPEDSPREEDP